MKSSGKLISIVEFGRILTLFLGVTIGLLYVPNSAIAATNTFNNKKDTLTRDSSLSVEIKRQLNRSTGLVLNYPNSVNRFYTNNRFQLTWIKPQVGFGQTLQAMLLLDCVLQYGLAHADYHPKKLIYDKLHDLLEKPEKYNDAEKARFEITLTDALITFINHLHFGKLNPDFPANKIDNTSITLFRAEDILLWATNQPDFMNAIVSVQPKSKTYIDMQDHMRLLVGQYQADCYEIPQENIRKIAINMERMRWFNTDDKTYIQINIPSYMLTFQKPDTAILFKVIVGKPISPTPTLQSYITHFTTAPEWKVPKSIFIKEILPKALKDTTYLENHHYSIYDNNGKYIDPQPDALARIKYKPGIYYARQSSGCDNALGLIVFRFQNIYSIYLHDTPEHLLFTKAERAFSHSCIRVDHTEELASLLLKNDGGADKLPKMRQALKTNQTKNFIFTKPVPIKITYLTCEIKEGLLINYKDIYNLDKRLELALYNDEALTMK